MTEFYFQGKIAFHLGLESNGKENGWNIISTIPSEILEKNRADISMFKACCMASGITKERFLDGVANIIISDPQAHVFFFEEFLFENSSMTKTELFEYIFKNIDCGFVLSGNDWFSKTNQPEKYFILRQKYFQIRRFYTAADVKFRACIRQEFESILPNHSASLEYVQLVSPTNYFLIFDDSEDDFVIYFLLENAIPNMMIIIERIRL